MARATLAAMSGLDVRSILPALDVPTLVIHATDDVVPVQLGRYLADHIPERGCSKWPATITLPG